MIRHAESYVTPNVRLGVTRRVCSMALHVRAKEFKVRLLRSGTLTNEAASQLQRMWETCECLTCRRYRAIEPPPTPEQIAATQAADALQRKRDIARYERGLAAHDKARRKSDAILSEWGIKV